MKKEWVFGAIINGELSAFHNSKKVMRLFIKSYIVSNQKDSVVMVRIKRNAAKKLQTFDAYYLVEWEQGYIQSKFYDIMDIDCYNLNYNSLKTQLEEIRHKNITPKQKKALDEVIDLLKNKEKTSYFYIPSLKYLNERYWMYEEWKNHTYLD